jgi:diguanylate cyclase (GGDEF)-like protein/PAS domain S-box-containing protein
LIIYIKRIFSLFLFLAASFVSISISAITIQSEDDFNQAFQLINNNDLTSMKAKEQLYVNFLSELEPYQNSYYSIIVVHKLHYFAVLQTDKEKAKKWLSLYNHLLVKIKSKKSLINLNFLKKLPELLELQNEQRHVTLLNNATALLDQSKKLEITQNTYLVNNELNVSEIEIALIHNLMGGSYFQLGNYDLAQQSFITASKIFQRLGKLKMFARSYGNLSLIRWAQKDFQSALNYSKKTLSIFVQLDDNQGYMTNLSNQGVYYSNLKQYDNAIAAYQKALNNPKSALFPKEKLVAMLALADTYLSIHELALAESIIRKALKISEETDNKYNYQFSKLSMGRLLVLQGEYQQALDLYESILPYYQKNKLQFQEAALYQLMSKAYLEKEDWQQAYLYYEQSTQLTNELNEKAQQHSVNQLQAQYQAENKQKQIDLLQTENKLSGLKVRSVKNQRFIIIALAISVLIILLLSVSRYYNKKEQLRLALHNQEIKDNEKQLMLLSNAFKNTSDAVWITNKDFEVEVVNNAYIALTHKDELDVIGQKVSFAQINGQEANLSEKLCIQAMVNGTWQGELYDQKSNGETYSLDLDIEAIKNDDGDIIHYLGVFRDITEKLKIQQQLSQLATHDELTGLPNRTLLNELIIQSSLNSQRSKKSPTILLLDVNGFKKINDTYGHNSGDYFICEIAKRLSKTLYLKDVIARINGAEFCILVELSEPKYGAIAVARKILSCFESTFNLDDHHFNITASIGITRFPEDAMEPQELLRKAAIAMIDNKNQMQSDYSFFEQHMNNEVNAQLANEQNLLMAIKADLFEFYYQPLIDINTGNISGAEALIRWIEPNGNIIYPDAFIPFAERLGLIDLIDEITIDNVFQQIALWQKGNEGFGPISINLSAKMFSKSGVLISLLTDKLIQYKIPSTLVKIEITEGMLLNDIEKAITTMEQIKALGFKLSLDDFGTGFSSLSYLKKFPIDILKIDRSFIMDMHESSVDQSIVRSIIDLAHNLNLSVVAEGVELVEHLEFLQQLNCEEYQGYYFSKAIPIADIERLVKTQKNKEFLID